MQTNPAVEQNKNIEWSESPWNQSVDQYCYNYYLQVASRTHADAGRPSDIGCQYSRSIYTACFIMRQPRRAANTSTNWW